MILNSEKKLSVHRFKVQQEKIMIVSDLHIYNNLLERPLFLKALNKERPSILIINGDLFEKMHFKVSERHLKSILVKIFKKNNSKIIFYVISSSSHDPIVDKRVITIKLNSKLIYVINGALELSSNSLKIFLTHGDYICKNGFIAGLISVFLKKLGVNLFLEKRLRYLLKLDKNTWLIIGHTHIPGINYSLRIANTGTWKSYWRKRATNTYLVVNKGLIKLKAIFP